jgi:hypothetical protein
MLKNILFYKIPDFKYFLQHLYLLKDDEQVEKVLILYTKENELKFMEILHSMGMSLAAIDLGKIIICGIKI